MGGKFERKRFADIDINDPFFDSLKADYPGSPVTKSFAQWFHEKAAEGKEALVFEENGRVGAFINLKIGENESIKLKDKDDLRPLPRVKITTIKIDDRYKKQRIGEGALGLTLWEWRDSKLDEIYLTVFAKHVELINLLEKYGFVCVGTNLNNEKVYLKSRKRLDFKDPCKAFPFISNNIQTVRILPIDMGYHDTMFAYSELANTLQEKVNISVANGLKKVYIGNPTNLPFREGEPVLIYRKYTGNVGSHGFKSVITSYCIITKVVKIRKNNKPIYRFDQFLRLVGNKFVFSLDELRKKYEELSNLTLIELLYYGYFGAGNNVNWIWLKNNNIWTGYPMSLALTAGQFRKILQEGKINADNVIIN